MQKEQLPHDVWTIRNVLLWTTNRFKEADIVTARLDAQILLCHVLNFEKIKLYTNSDAPLTQEERARLRELVKRRLRGEPVAYILGEKDWYDIKLHVNSHVLIPRPETETLLDFVLEATQFLDHTPQVIFDFCTGSGCLAIALAKRYPQATVVGIDISNEALQVSKQNAQLNHVSNITFLNRDLTQKETYQTLLSNYGKACIIVANPPYVSLEEWEELDAEVKHYEPKLALVADDQGLAIGKKIFQWTNEYSLLNENSVFCMEMSEHHPQKILAQETPCVPFSSTMWQKPTEQWFALADLENKTRFLAKICHHS